MVIYYVAGGSYRSFYLNNFLKIKRCDLLIFNYGVFNNIENSFQCCQLIKEVKSLSKKLNCAIIFIVSVKKFKKIGFFNKKNVYFYHFNKILNVKICHKIFAVGKLFSNFKAKNKIIFCDNVNVNIKNCSENNTYLFCYDKKIEVVQDKKIKRNFNKCSKIILK